MKRRAIVYYLRTGQVRLALTVLFMPKHYALTYDERRSTTDYQVSAYCSKNWRQTPRTRTTR